MLEHQNGAGERVRTMAKRSQGQGRYAIYLRCSSDDQAHGDFTTIDTQREINTRHIIQNGGTLAKVYADEGKSGTNLKRPDWQALLRDAEAKLFDKVCVTYMSRLARGEAYHIAEYLLSEMGVEIELVRERFTEDLAGHVNKQMTILMDGMYPKMVSQWTRTKVEEMVKRGYWCGQMPSMGYRKEFVTDAGGFSKSGKEPPKRLVVEERGAEILQKAFTLFAQTKNFPAVVDYLRLTTGRQWTIDSVTRLLRNDVYCGVQRFGDWVNEKAHEAIISEELWQAVRAADEDRNHTRSPKTDRVDDFPYYLRGVVYCPQCGSKMTPMWHTGRTGVVRYYECLKGLKKLTACPVRRVNALMLHETILHEIERAAKHPTRMSTLICEAVKVLPHPEDLTAEYKLMERRVIETDKRIARCQEAIEMSTGSLRSLVERLEALETERVQIQAKKRELEEQGANLTRKRPNVNDACTLWSRFGELWNKATEEERTELMQALVFKVEMNQKDEGTCEIALLPQVPISGLELNSYMGAPTGLEPVIVI